MERIAKARKRYFRGYLAWSLIQTVLMLVNSRMP